MTIGRIHNIIAYFVQLIPILKGFAFVFWHSHVALWYMSLPGLPFSREEDAMILSRCITGLLRYKQIV